MEPWQVIEALRADEHAVWLAIQGYAHRLKARFHELTGHIHTTATHDWSAIAAEVAKPVEAVKAEVASVSGDVVKATEEVKGKEAAVVAAVEAPSDAPHAAA